MNKFHICGKCSQSYIQMINIRAISEEKMKMLSLALFLALVVLIFVFRVDGYLFTARPQAGISNILASWFKDDYKLPVAWGNLGEKLTESGVIDREKFLEIYKQRGLESEAEALLNSGGKNIRINKKNAGVVLNVLWAFGLANKNEILENGPMTDPRYGGADRFASTGGWNLSKGDSMDYYSKFPFLELTKNQQKLVVDVASGIYRPCCDNPAYFPDCNHGMAMLGLLELLAAQNLSREEMFENALIVNAFWFPDTYQNIAAFLKQKGINSASVEPEKIVGKEFTSFSGYQKVLQELKPENLKSGGSCGV